MLLELEDLAAVDADAFEDAVAIQQAVIVDRDRGRLAVCHSPSSQMVGVPAPVPGEGFEGFRVVDMWANVSLGTGGAKAGVHALRSDPTGPQQPTGREYGMRPNRWSEPQLDRRTYPRAEYRRTAPALLELESYRCAVRDLAPGGLRIEPAPAGRVWEVGERVSGILHLRTVGRLLIDAVIGRIDRSGLALVPDDGPWPESSVIDAERSSLVRWHHERRSAPAAAPPAARSGRHPLRDVSATGLRYALAPTERAPATGSHVEGELRLDNETVIPVRGQGCRHIGREIAVALDPPGLTPEILALLRRRFFPEGADTPS